MIKQSEIEIMAETLRQYDVVDGGWQHESKGVDFNLRHVLIHLADMSDRKDFADEDKVRDEIAPDLAQYGLRIARWANVDTGSLVIKPREMAYPAVQEKTQQYGGDISHYEDWFTVTAVMGILARDRHPVDHGDKATGSLDRENLGIAAHMLLWAADDQASHFRFNLVEEFDARIAELRVTRNVPRLDES